MNNPTIAGKNIFTDKRQRIVYYDSLSKKGFQINSEDMSKFYIYKNRFILLTLGILLLSDSLFSWPIAIGVGIGIWLLLEVMFRKYYFAKLKSVVITYTMEERTIINMITSSKEKGKTIAKVLLYLAFSILVLLNVYIQKPTIPIIILSIILSLAGLYYSTLHLLGFMKIK